ncbi:MAG: TIR domain-containing protein [Leptolyngbya sp. PLA1]|nr:TIR domain-containing protein [Leptolyngbya sp. PLA1]
MAPDPLQLARLEDLGRKFEDGLRVFREAGKSVDSLPWFLFIGPPSSGKSELIRHCGVGFPPGLQDRMQGMGGTVNIHWWFTNYAVLLDVAGGLTIAPGRQCEWEALLARIRLARPRTPVNGVVVVLSASQLLVQPDAEIVRSARALRASLDVLSGSFRSLVLPVYLFVSQCDRLVGYREFTDPIQDPYVAQQMLGRSWAGTEVHAPAELRLEEAARALHGRLWARVLGWLPFCESRDAAASLLCLPESFDRLIPRIGLVTSRLFPDEHLGRSLQLRGLYFGNAVRQGGVLDLGAAALQGIPIHEYSPDWAESEERSNFIRDVLLSKVLRERDLATFDRVTWLSRLARRLLPASGPRVEPRTTEPDLIRELTPEISRAPGPPAAVAPPGDPKVPEAPPPQHFGPGRLRSPKGLTPYTGSERFAFLSYANRDAEAVVPWLEAVHEAGLRVWWDAGITAGRPYNDVIAERIRACTVFVVFLTPGVIDSEWVQDEIDRAKKLRKTRIAVTATAIKIPDGLDLLLGRMQRIETANRAESIRQLSESLRLHLVSNA